MNLFARIMPRGYWIAAALTITTLGATMTMPGTPNLPESVANSTESPAVMRIGVVADIVESDSITVRISGTPVLVQASYLFPQYLPVLGDLVAVIKQDAQWLVLGTMSGSINSLAMNPSFENGATGATPSDWNITSVSGAGGTITFQKQAGSYLGQPIAGNFVGAVDFTSNGVAAASQSNITSDMIPADGNEQWTGALWIAGGIMSSGTLSLQTLFLEFFDPSSALLSSNTIAQYTLGDVTIPRTYLRPQATNPSFTSPVDTAFVRLRLNVQFVMPAPAGGTVSTVFYDYAILRGPV
jgi:hypothetical protein